MSFWDRLKQEIKEKNTTQAWLAATTGVSFGTLRKWLTNKTMPNADQAVAIARALGVTVEYLVTGTDSSDPWVREHAWLIKHLKELTDEQYPALEQYVVALAVGNMKARRQSGEMSS